MNSYPSELRLGSLENRWVLIASGRAHRPHDWAEVSAPEVKRDPFDPHNVHPDEITDRIINDDGAKYSVPSDWKTLSISNSFPFLAPSNDHPHLKGSVVDGYGFHEVIIHSPERDRNFEDFTPEQTRAVLELYLKRYNHMAHQDHIQHVQIFTNRGSEAGASVVHPHSQIVALPVVPPYIQQLVDAAKVHHRKHESSVAEDEVTKESKESTRVVYENSQFLVYCPFAPHADYHIRIMPKQPGSHFHEITEEQLEHLSRVINLAYRRLDRIAGVPPYNAFVRTAPIHAADLTGFRWHIDIVPHLSIPGGLELSTGLDVVTVTPEDAARALRQDS
jgi:UDPglucose--hexose-1-phosphate uridylyltransferase